ncbi:hypothetical protein GAY28_00275 [Azospirillum brasilense]|nr:hypothetical protein [Azospirillum brasilense]
MMPLIPPAPYGVFRYASSELSSSGFWAWIFAGLAEDPVLAAGQRAVAAAVLEAVGCPAPNGAVVVKTESGLSDDTGRVIGRADLRIFYGDTEVLIENKVKAMPTTEQLRRYAGARIDRPGFVPLLFSITFDDQVIDSLPGVRVGLGRTTGQAPWTIFRPEDLLAVAAHGRALHPFIDDYARSLEHLLLRRQTIRRLALSADRDGLTEALATHEGQWYLMQALTVGLCAERYQGTNTGGRPWTQCCFTEDSAPGRDALFYRIDFDMGGRREWQPYLSLQQYQKRADDGKKARLASLRAHALDALRSVSDASFYVPADTRNPQMESAIIRFRLRETPFPDLQVFFQRFHDAFVAAAEPDGGFISLKPCGVVEAEAV